MRLSIFKVGIFSELDSIFFKSKLTFWGLESKNKPDWAWVLLLLVLLFSSFFINILLFVVSKLFLLLVIILLLFWISKLITDEDISPDAPDLILLFPEDKFISLIFDTSISPLWIVFRVFSGCWDKLISLLVPSKKIPPDGLDSKFILLLILILLELFILKAL